jgi:hypothetical protein
MRTLPGITGQGRNYLWRLGPSGNARLLGVIIGIQELEYLGCPVSVRPGKSGPSASPTETPQVRDTVANPHRNPTDGTAYSGTLVMRVKCTENSR